MIDKWKTKYLLKKKLLRNIHINTYMKNKVYFKPISLNTLYINKKILLAQIIV